MRGRGTGVAPGEGEIAEQVGLFPCGLVEPTVDFYLRVGEIGDFVNFFTHGIVRDGFIGSCRHHNPGGVIC